MRGEFLGGSNGCGFARNADLAEADCVERGVNVRLLRRAEGLGDVHERAPAARLRGLSRDSVDVRKRNERRLGDGRCEDRGGLHVLVAVEGQQACLLDLLRGEPVNERQAVLVCAELLRAARVSNDMPELLH